MCIRDRVEAIEIQIGMPKGSGGTIWSRVNRIRDFFLSLIHISPLTIVRGNAELLSEPELTTEQKKNITNVLNGTTQIQSYVKQLIDCLLYTSSL